MQEEKKRKKRKFLSAQPSTCPKKKGQRDPHPEVQTQGQGSEQGSGQERKKVRRTTSLRVQLAKRSNASFSFYFKKIHQNPHFSQLTEVRAPLTLSLYNFCQLGQALAFPHTPKKNEKNPQLPVCV